MLEKLNLGLDFTKTALNLATNLRLGYGLPRMLGLWISSVVRFMDLRYFVVYGVVLRVVLGLR